MKKFCVRFLSLLIILCMFSSCMLSINTQDETANAAASANDTARPMDPATANQPTAEPAPEPTTTPEPIPEPTPEPTEEPMTIENAEGIIALEANLTGPTQTDPSGRMHFGIIAIDPTNGSQNVFVEIDLSVASDDHAFLLPFTSYVSSAREWFSDDYSKLALTLMSNSNNARDAGWCNMKGEYINVTALLGMQPQGDFDAPKHFEAIGFSSDGYFVFCDNDDRMNPIYYSVPIDNITLPAVEQRNAIKDSLPTFESRALCFNDWIDDTHCLVDYLYDGRIDEKTESLIFDTATGETSKYIPGDGRYTWCGVASPDGSMAAFLSSPKSGTEQPALYTVLLTEEEPIRNPASFVFTPDNGSSRRPPFVLYPNLRATCVTLLEWR